LSQSSQHIIFPEESNNKSCTNSLKFNYCHFNNYHNNNKNMDSTQTQTQRRNKKQRPPDYYKKEYVEILKIENENVQQAAANHKLLNIDKNENITISENESVQEELSNLIIDEQIKLNAIKKEINNNIEETQSQSQSVLITTTNEQTSLVTSESELISLPVQLPPPPPPSSTLTIAQSSAPTTKSWANLFKPGSIIDSSNQEFKQPQLTKQQTSQSTLNKTQTENLMSQQQQQQQQQQPQRDNKVRRTSSSSSFTQTISQQPVSPQLLTESSQETLKTLGHMFKSYELKHSAPALQPRGLVNKSNWCYINAVSVFFSPLIF
jgi:hypothetical protein